MPSIDRDRIFILLKYGLLALAIVDFALWGWTQLDRRSIVGLKDHKVELQRSVDTAGGRVNIPRLRVDVQDATEQLEKVSVVFPSRVDAVALQDHVVSVAQRNAVIISNMSVDPSATRTLNKSNYPVVVMAVEGKGSLPGLYGFLHDAERLQYETRNLESIILTNQTIDWFLKFNLVVYYRPK